MHCSRCSELVKPVVCIDIDGTLGDYHGHFLRFAGDWVGVRQDDNYSGREPYRDWFCKAFRTDLTTFRQIKLAYRQGGMKRTMPVYPYATELCEAVHNAGGELWLTTTRPYLSLDGIDRDTRAWLDRNWISYDRLLYDENKYDVVAERVDPERVVAVLDDEEEQCLHAVRVWDSINIPIQRGTRYNESARFQPRCETLESACNVIVNRITQWKGSHD